MSLYDGWHLGNRRRVPLATAKLVAGMTLTVRTPHALAWLEGPGPQDRVSCAGDATAPSLLAAACDRAAATRRGVVLTACVRARVTSAWGAALHAVAHGQGTGRCRMPRAMLQKLQLRPGRRFCGWRAVQCVCEGRVRRHAQQLALCSPRAPPHAQSQCPSLSLRARPPA